MMHLLGDERRAKFADTTFVHEEHADGIHASYFDNMDRIMSSATAKVCIV